MSGSRAVVVWFYDRRCLVLATVVWFWRWSSGSGDGRLVLAMVVWFWSQSFVGYRSGASLSREGVRKEGQR